MDLDSGHEQGALDLGSHVRGIIPLNKRILAFDGDRKAVGKYVAFVTWKERELAVEKPVVT